MIEAYRHAPTAVVAPLVYLQLVWSAGLGFVLFSEVPALRTSLGAGLITIAGVLLVRAGMATGRPSGTSG
jgi:drug/metabolite transporter (DMT)-like permease